MFYSHLFTHHPTNTYWGNYTLNPILAGEDKEIKRILPTSKDLPASQGRQPGQGSVPESSLVVLSPSFSASSLLSVPSEHTPEVPASLQFYRPHPPHPSPSPLSSLIWVNSSSCCYSCPLQPLSLSATWRISERIQVTSCSYPAKSCPLLSTGFEMRFEFLPWPARHQLASISSIPSDVPVLCGSCSLSVSTFAPLLPKQSFPDLCMTRVASAQTFSTSERPTFLFKVGFF